MKLLTVCVSPEIVYPLSPLCSFHFLPHPLFLSNEVVDNKWLSIVCEKRAIMTCLLKKWQIKKNLKGGETLFVSRSLFVHCLLILNLRYTGWRATCFDVASLLVHRLLWHVKEHESVRVTLTQQAKQETDSRQGVSQANLSDWFHNTINIDY